MAFKAKQRCDGLRQGPIAAHSWAVTRPAESSGLNALKLSGSIMAGLLNAGANGIQSNSWSNSAHQSVALSAGLIQKEAVAWVRANRTPRLPATQICAGFWLTVRARLSRRAGVKPRPTFFLQQARDRNSCATPASTMKISENPMESDFCILNVVSRTEVVANATRRAESQCEGGRPA
jgi:hypothetical protein